MDISSLLAASLNKSAAHTRSGVLGSFDDNQIAELNKALTAGYGSDPAAFTGGAALRIQSLDKTLMSTIQENKHFKLMNALAKSDATATVDEWSEQNSIGGFLGGSTNTETGIIRGATGGYKRRVEEVKYLMTRREVSFVSTLGNNIVEAETVEQTNGALQLLTDAEFLSFEGAKDVVPTEFDGILAQVVKYATADHVIDMRGGSLSNITKVNQGAAVVAAYGNYGVPTDLFVSQLVQADFDNNLDPAFRVQLTATAEKIKLGGPVAGVSTSWGTIMNNPDVFIRDEQQQKPFQSLSAEHAAIATANTFGPASVTPTVAAAAGSMFDAATAGLYYYAVTGINADGQSVATVTAQQTVAAGEGVTLTIAPSVGGLETGYVIYRGRKGGTNALTDLREMIRIPKTAVSTVYIDKNLDLPGTSKAYLLNMQAGAKAITWRQLLPMMKFPLYPTATATVPWAQLLFGYLRLAKARHHVVYKNIVPAGALWKPFG